MIEDNLLWFTSISLIVFIIIWVRFRVEIVPEEKRIVVYRLGRFSRLAGPGPVLLLQRIDKVERTIHVRDQPAHYVVDGLFIYDIPFGYTINLWRRFDLAAATHNQPRALAELAQFDDEERNLMIQVQLREALIHSVAAVQQQRPLPRTAQVIDRLLPIMPGLADCIQMLDNARAELERTLPSYGVILSDAHPITIERLHLSQHLIDIFNRNQIVELLRQRFPNLSEDAMVQVVAAIHGINPSSVRILNIEEDNHEIKQVLDSLVEEWETISTGIASLSIDEFEHTLDNMAQSFAKIWNLPLPRFVSRTNSKKLRMYYCDTSSIFDDLESLTRISLIFIQQARFMDEYILELQNFIKKEGKFCGGCALAVLFCNEEDLKIAEDMFKNRISVPYAYDIIPLHLNYLTEFLSIANPKYVLRKFILDNINLITVSPFTVNGPVSDRIFSGRELELREITDNVSKLSYAIIGGRRIGKSSLLGQLYRVHLPEAGFRVLYHDCSTTPDFESFLSISLNNWHLEKTSGTFATFADLLQSPPKDKPLVILLDEADKLIPYDYANHWKLFSLLRGFVNSGGGQIILSGERSLREALRNPQSPLFNFTNEKILRPFNIQSTEELIGRGMKSLEIELNNPEEIIRLIYNFTGGHPNIIQRLGNRLIRQLNQKGRRHITPNDVNEIMKDPAFQRDDFLTTYWEAASPLEKIISLLMADDETVCTLQTIRQALINRCNLRPKTREVDDAIQHLVDLRSILKRTATGYDFAVTAFPQVMANTITLKDMLEIWSEEYQEHQS